MVIYLGSRLLTISSDLPESHRGSSGPHSQRDCRCEFALCLILLRAGFAKPAESPRLLVSSYLTVSPLPRTGPTNRNRQETLLRMRFSNRGTSRSAVCFLLHFPSPFGGSALPTALLDEARTFLSCIAAATILVDQRSRYSTEITWFGKIHALQGLPFGAAQSPCRMTSVGTRQKLCLIASVVELAIGIA
jgi:hypothetical protein